MRNFILQFTLVLVLTAACFACGGGDNSEKSAGDDSGKSTTVGEKPAPPKPVAASWSAMEKAELEEGTLVTFEAWVGDLPSTMYTSGGRINLDFFPRRNQDDGFHIYARIPAGSGPNQVKPLPANYLPSDLHITADDKSRVGVGDYVRMEGKFKTSSGDNYNYVDVDKIEKVEPEFDPAVFETAVELTDSLLHDPTYDGGYVYLDGNLELSYFMSTFGDDSYTVTIKQKNNTSVKSVSIRMGESASTMQPLPNKFTDKDFIVRDYKGDPHKGKGKFRLYGTFGKFSSTPPKAGAEVRGSFKVEEIAKK